MKKVIDSFSGRNHYLSNFHHAPVNFEGIIYLNNEAAFQAQKDLSRRREFTNIQPNKAKPLGRRVTLRTDWEDVKIQVMRDVVRAKFTQHENLKKNLIATAGTELIEGNWWKDRFWGVDTNGKGRNELGKILMELRDEFISA